MFSGFKATKCKTAAKLCVSRIKLLRNKRNSQLVHMEREIADLLKHGKDECAWIRVEAVYREKSLLAGYEILELYLELIGVRAHLLEKAKGAPVDMVEALTSLMYAAPRVADLPELHDVRKIVINKFGKELGLETATEEPKTWQVNVNLRRYLSVAPPEVEQKLNLLSTIAKQNGVDIDLEDFSRGVVIQQKNPHGPPEGATSAGRPPIPVPDFQTSPEKEIMPPQGWVADMASQDLYRPGPAEIPVYANPYGPNAQRMPIAPPPPENPNFKSPTELELKGPYTDAQGAAIAAQKAADEAATAASLAKEYADRVPKNQTYPGFVAPVPAKQHDYGQQPLSNHAKTTDEVQKQYDEALGPGTKLDTHGPPSAPPISVVGKPDGQEVNCDIEDDALPDTPKIDMEKDESPLTYTPQTQEETPDIEEFLSQQQTEQSRKNPTDEEAKFVSEPAVPGHNLEQPAMPEIDGATEKVVQAAATDTATPTDEESHAQYPSENAPGQVKDAAGDIQEDTPKSLDVTDDFARRLAMLKKAQWTDEL